MALKKNQKTRNKFNPTLLLGIILLFLLITVNVYLFASTPAEILQAKIQASSISRGESYFGRLQLWKIYMLHNDYVNAAKYEATFDPVDIYSFSQLYSPSALKEQINRLQLKSNKNSEDWIALSQLYYRLGDKKLALDALNQARVLDPIRDDLFDLIHTLN